MESRSSAASRADASVLSIYQLAPLLNWNHMILPFVREIFAYEGI